MKNRGFTLVELIIVSIIILILSGIITTAYVLYTNRAADKQADALTKQVIDASERYYNRYQNYPTAIPTANTPPSSSSYATIATVLDTPRLGLDDGKFDLFPCTGTCTIPNTSGDYVYYLMKGGGTGTAVSYTINGCIFTFPASETNGDSYVIGYKKKENGNWVWYRSVNGAPTTNDTTYCPFQG